MFFLFPFFISFGDITQKPNHTLALSLNFLTVSLTSMSSLKGIAFFLSLSYLQLPGFTTYLSWCFPPSLIKLSLSFLQSPFLNSKRVRLRTPKRTSVSPVTSTIATSQSQILLCKNPIHSQAKSSENFFAHCTEQCLPNKLLSPFLLFSSKLYQPRTPNHQRNTLYLVAPVWTSFCFGMGKLGKLSLTFGDNRPSLARATSSSVLNISLCLTHENVIVLKKMRNHDLLASISVKRLLSSQRKPKGFGIEGWKGCSLLPVSVLVSVLKTQCSSSQADLSICRHIFLVVFSLLTPSTLFPVL